MSIRIRRVSVYIAMGTIIVLANATLICAWLDRLGLIGLARWVRQEYLTGTAICVILAMLWLFRGDGRCWARARPCSVCGRALEPGARYCPHCGSRAG